MIPADPKPSSQRSSRNLELRNDTHLRATEADEIVNKTLESFGQYLKSEFKRCEAQEEKRTLSSGFTKENYRREKELLNRRLRSLITNAHICKVAATQTVLSGDTVMELPKNDFNFKSLPLTEIRILDRLKNYDSQLIDRISARVQQKLTIQKGAAEATNLQLLRKNMRNEKYAAIRKLKDVQRRHMEKLKQSHRIQMKNVESEYDLERERFTKRINRLQGEIKTLNDRLDKCERELRDSKADGIKLQAENRMLQEENRMFRRQLTTKADTDQSLQKSALLISELREKLRKSEEAKELILKQFQLLETERDELMQAIRDGMHEVNKVNRLGDKILTAEIARTEKQFSKTQNLAIADSWNSSTDLSSVQ